MNEVQIKEIQKRIKSKEFSDKDNAAQPQPTLNELLNGCNQQEMKISLNRLRQLLCDENYSDKVTEHIYKFNCDNGGEKSIGTRKLHSILVYLCSGKFPFDSEKVKNRIGILDGLIENIFTYEGNERLKDAEELPKEPTKTTTDYKDLLESQKQIILQGPPGTGKTRLAKIIAINMINADNPIGENASNDAIKEAFEALGNQVKLIQFHPSYSYEDFVRGITAKTIEIKDNIGNVTGSMISYVVENKILAQMAKNANAADKKKPYILIIDEINRANLSSVLGELIYALEYRDEEVESMYELEENGQKSRGITLPSNLYIIGTMNTADRSIGHIDYAIRRRFTFVDVKSNEDVLVDNFSIGNSLYKVVEDLFTEKYVSPEFNIQDIKIGHSYFIAKDDNDLKRKLEYQVKPLLKEYVKDGVLNENTLEMIEKLNVSDDSELEK